MKKLIIKCLLMVGIMVGISNYALYVMTGKTPFGQTPDIALSLPGKQAIQQGLSGDRETVYKWTDAEGKTHYSSTPPASQTLATKMDVDPDTNLIQGLQARQKKPAPARPAEAPSMPTGNMYHPAAVKKLVDDAKNVQNLLDERDTATQKALDSL